MISTFVNESALVGTNVWAGMGLFNFILGILILVQFYLAFVEKDDRDTVFPFVRSTNPNGSFAVFIILVLMFFMGTALSRGSMFSFTAASFTYLGLFVALLPGSDFVRKDVGLNEDAFLVRVGLFVAAISAFIALVCSPSSVTRLFLAPLTLYVVAGMILTESHHDIFEECGIQEKSTADKKNPNA